MRSIGVVLLLTGLAVGDPPGNPSIEARPNTVIEAPAWEPPARATTKVPSMKGPDSAAMVIDPSPHGDARPWPDGIWIRPPESGDRNQIELGTSDLPASDRLSVKLARAVDRGVGELLEWLLTPRFVRQL